jgi:hypothetical protein
MYPETCKFYLYVEPEFANSPKMKVETFQAKAWRAEESLGLVTICTVMKKRTSLRSSTPPANGGRKGDSKNKTTSPL